MEKIIKIYLGASLTLLTFVLPNFFSNSGQILAQEGIAGFDALTGAVSPNDYYLRGRASGTGAYFELENSQYLNVILKSSEKVRVVLESIPKMISLDIEVIEGGATSAQLTIEGLEPNKSYYKYQDSYQNGAVFVSDEQGNYSWLQDLSEPHHIWIQEQKSTTFLPDDCASYGVWDAVNSICTLNQDLTQSVEITTNNIILDCAGHKITTSLPNTYGVYLNNRSGVSIKNCQINNFLTGIYLFNSDNNTLTNNTASGNYNGISLPYSSGNTLAGNIVNSNRGTGINIWGLASIFGLAYDNILEGNTANFNHSEGLVLSGASNSFLRNNTMSANTYNFELSGASDVEFDNDINTSNLVEGRPIYYIKNAVDTVYGGSTNAGTFYCINCERITVRNLSFDANYYGVSFWKTNNSLLENVAVSNNFYGVSFLYAHNNILTNSTISNNYKAIKLIDQNNVVSNNKIYHNNFIENEYVIYREGINNGNLFDNGYPSGGNFWSGYVPIYHGSDSRSGINQDQPGPDGIGDFPYPLYTGGLWDRYPFMEPSGWAKPQRWSFAIISDLHVGQGFLGLDLDYGALGWNDGASGEDSVTSVKKLKETVSIINNNKDNYNIEFVAVTGDFTDSAEISELYKAREILDTLEIPWIPIIGNHDIWPFYGENPHPQPLIEMAPEVDANNNGADKYFHNIFNSQYEKLSAVLPGWQKENAPVWNPETNPIHNSYFQNFSFDYQGFHFFGLDFNHRDNEIDSLKGAAAEGTLYNFPDGTWDWFKNNLSGYISQHPEGQKNIILLAHHPFKEFYYKFIGIPLSNIGFSNEELKTISDYISNYQDKIVGEFAGHTHKTKDFYWQDGKIHVIETDANVSNPLIRIVQVYPNGAIDYSKFLPEKQLYIIGHSPIDLIVTDPDGLVISQQSNNIPGAIYSEEDLDGDNDIDDLITIPDRKLGDYQIQVIPELDATSTQTYTLEVGTIEDSFGYVPFVLVQDALISEIPDEPYLWHSQERQGTELVYTGASGEQYFDAINLSAVLKDGSGNPLADKDIIFEVAGQQVSTTTDSSGVATAILKLEQIPEINYLVEAFFGGDEDYLPSYTQGFFILKSPKTIKQEAILDLEAVKTKSNRVSGIIGQIQKSLVDNLWLDEFHLFFSDEVSGKAVFNNERSAVKLMLDELNGKTPVAGDLRIVYNQVISKLVRADHLLTEIILYQAEDILIRNPELPKVIEEKIKIAEEQLIEAEDELSKNNPDRAISELSKSWLNSQLVIQMSSLEE